MKLEKKLYSTQVLEIIKQDLLSGVLLPGDKVNEAQLASRLGISRAPIREALCLLEREGIIDSVQNKGKIIRTLTPKQVYDTYMTGAILEAQGVVKTYHKYSDQDYRHLLSLLNSVSEDFFIANKHYTLDESFHRALLKYVDNEVLLNLSRQLPNRMSKFLLTKYWQKFSTPDAFYERHHELYKVLLTQKDKDIEEAVLDHYSVLANKIISYMESD